MRRRRSRLTNSSRHENDPTVAVPGVSCLFLVLVRDFVLPRRVARCRHPSIRTLAERLVRSVQVGCSRFSRCCHLLVEPLFHLQDGSWARPLTQSAELGAWALCFLSMNLNHAAAGSRT